MRCDRSEFENPTGLSANALERALVARIRERGPMAFEQFMERALYDPQGGYYTAGAAPWGYDADYVTVPQVGDALGTAIARLVVEVDAALGCPDPFHLCEMGGGNGQLAATVLKSLARAATDLHARLHFHAIEAGPRSRQLMRDTLPAPGRGLDISATVDGLPRAVAGFAYSNELLDAFPVRRLRSVAGEIRESRIHVGTDGQLQERFDGVISIQGRKYLDDNAVRLRDGQIAEVCTGVEPWFATLDDFLASGAILTVDYGHETATLYGENRHSGSLVCQHRLRLNDEPLRRPGEQDITAHVDFGNLLRIGSARAWLPHGPCSLRVFLIGMQATVAAAHDPAWRSRLQLRHLLVSEVGDSHFVTLQTRGLGESAPRFGRARLDALVDAPSC